MDSAYHSRVAESAAYIRAHFGSIPKVAAILGSGLGTYAESLEKSRSIPTKEVPHYPQGSVAGHKGTIVVARVGSTPLLAFQGRVHYYETGNLDPTMFPVHVASALGIRTLIVTNAAGGINRMFSPGDLMLITDQINLTFLSPRDRRRDRLVRRLLYSPRLAKLAVDCALRERIPLKQGVYAGVKGPSYETAAEILMLRQIGGDAVGMSTVIEVELASQLGLEVLGISCITNLATGIGDQPLSHQEVTDVGERVKNTFSQLLTSIITSLDTASSHAEGNQT